MPVLASPFACGLGPYPVTLATGAAFDRGSPVIRVAAFLALEGVLLDPPDATETALKPPPPDAKGVRRALVGEAVAPAPRPLLGLAVSHGVTDAVVRLLAAHVVRGPPTQTGPRRPAALGAPPAPLGRRGRPFRRGRATAVVGKAVPVGTTRPPVLAGGLAPLRVATSDSPPPLVLGRATPFPGLPCRVGRPATGSPVGLGLVAAVAETRGPIVGPSVDTASPGVAGAVTTPIRNGVGLVVGRALRVGTTVARRPVLGVAVGRAVGVPALSLRPHVGRVGPRAPCVTAARPAAHTGVYSDKVAAPQRKPRPALLFSCCFRMGDIPRSDTFDTRGRRRRTRDGRSVGVDDKTGGRRRGGRRDVEDGVGGDGGGDSDGGRSRTSTSKNDGGGTGSGTRGNGSG